MTEDAWALVIAGVLAIAGTLAFVCLVSTLQLYAYNRVVLEIEQPIVCRNEWGQRCDHARYNGYTYN